MGTNSIFTNRRYYIQPNGPLPEKKQAIAS